LVSRPYLDMTAAVMRAFGHDDVELSDDAIRVGAGLYRPTELVVEPDASAASYPLAIAALVGGSVEVPGIGEASLQGDSRFADLLAAMGCGVVRSSDTTRLTAPADAVLSGVDVDMSDISDLVPTLAC
jgi:3-phosphoshikimate 1-carboxyvinyltransferase